MIQRISMMAGLIELAIPIAPINAIDRGHTFGEGSMWRLNFSRVQWDYQINGNTYEKKTDNNGRRLPRKKLGMESTNGHRYA